MRLTILHTNDIHGRQERIAQIATLVGREDLEADAIDADEGAPLGELANRRHVGLLVLVTDEHATEIGARLKTLSYTIDYSYEEPHLVTWRYVDGDIRDVDGELVRCFLQEPAAAEEPAKEGVA